MMDHKETRCERGKLVGAYLLLFSAMIFLAK